MDWHKARTLLALLILLPAAACAGQSLPRIILETSLGEIVVEMDTVRAPLTAGNFLRLVDEDAFHGAVFYRVVRPDNQPDNPVRIEVIQGGLFDEKDIGEHEPIPHETTDETGIRHQDGIISMARMEPGTASTEFFICLGDQPSLDFGGKRNPDGQGFAAFGKVVRGMEVVRAIQVLPDEGQYLVDQVRIKTIRRCH